MAAFRELGNQDRPGNYPGLGQSAQLRKAQHMPQLHSVLRDVAWHCDCVWGCALSEMSVPVWLSVCQRRCLHRSDTPRGSLWGHREGQGVGLALLRNRRAWPGGWSSRVCPHGGGWQTSLHALLHRLPDGHQAAHQEVGSYFVRPGTGLLGPERGNGKPGICGASSFSYPFLTQPPLAVSGKDSVAACVNPPSSSSLVCLSKALALYLCFLF